MPDNKVTQNFFTAKRKLHDIHNAGLQEYTRRFGLLCSHFTITHIRCDINFCLVKTRGLIVINKVPLEAKALVNWFPFRNQRTFRLSSVYFTRLIPRSVDRRECCCHDNSKCGVYTELTMNFTGRNHLPFRQLSVLCTDIITYAISALSLIVLGR